MSDLQRIASPRFPDVRLRTPTNWTAVCFLAALGGVHLAVSVPATIYGRWEAALSFALGVLFLLAAMLACVFYVETALLPSRRQIRIRTGTRRWHSEKCIAFEAVTGVRLTLDLFRESGAQIEIICRTESLPIPSTPIPRQEALFFAMMLETSLVKVSQGDEEVAVAHVSRSPGRV